MRFVRAADHTFRHVGSAFTFSGGAFASFSWKRRTARTFSGKSAVRTFLPTVWTIHSTFRTVPVVVLGASASGCNAPTGGNATTSSGATASCGNIPTEHHPDAASVDFASFDAEYLAAAGFVTEQPTRCAHDASLVGSACRLGLILVDDSWKPNGHRSCRGRDETATSRW